MIRQLGLPYHTPRFRRDSLTFQAFVPPGNQDVSPNDNKIVSEDFRSEDLFSFFLRGVFTAKPATFKRLLMHESDRTRGNLCVHEIKSFYFN